MLEKIVFISGNKNKINEVSKILENSYASRLESKSVDLPEIQGTQDEIAIEKCREASKIIDGPCFVEDVSLCFDALNGLPGPYIKDFLGKLGAPGLLKMIKGFNDTSNQYKATAFCTIGFIDKKISPNVHIFKGEVRGTLVEPKGEYTFGWDPIFKPDGYELTYSEMPRDVKNSISHRSIAVMKLKEFLDTNY